jgi:ATP-dependent Lon protease
MLKLALENHRMFAVTPPNPVTSPKMEPYRIAGVGLVRACVDKPDGTSNLVLEGIARVRIKRFVQEKPYFIAEIEPLATTNTQSADTQALAAQLLELVARMHQTGEIQAKGLMDFLTQIKDHDALADIVSYSFVEDPVTKQNLLETLDLRLRLKRLVSALNDQGTKSKS